MTSRAPFIIALSGGSGSGKSGLATALFEALASRLGAGAALIVGEDDYYLPMSAYGDAETEAARAALADKINYDAPSAKEAERLAADLGALKAGHSVDAPIYDYGRHDRSAETQRLDPAPVIILEGIHALSMPAVRPLFDLTVYVDTPDDLRLARRLRRDVIERERSVESVLSQYLSTVRAAHYQYTYPAKFEADLVIADEGLPAYGHVRPTDRALERMLAPVIERLASAGVV
ncbi:MAG: uridine kinase [Pseudomonadota bacterium]